VCERSIPTLPGQKQIDAGQRERGKRMDEGETISEHEHVTQGFAGGSSGDFLEQAQDDADYEAGDEGCPYPCRVREEK